MGRVYDESLALEEHITSDLTFSYTVLTDLSRPGFKRWIFTFADGFRHATSDPSVLSRLHDRPSPNQVCGACSVGFMDNTYWLCKGCRAVNCGHALYRCKGCKADRYPKENR